MIIQSKEQITIEITETDNLVIVTVDGIDYAVFQECQIDYLDIDKIVNWVENTYYDGCYLSDQYIAPNLMISDFNFEGVSDDY